jgi:endonuclease/exonuclease/phosphatase family metal-dependent hydrolase
MPVVLTGDFNSDAATSTAPAVHADVIAAGFADAWAELKPTSTGNTWGRTELLDDPTSPLIQRLDYVFTRGAAEASKIDLLGEAAKDMFRHLWPSDHAGISAVISLR